MLGIVWGIATVTLLIAYGGSFRQILVGGFDAFGKSVVICWPQQTSEQPGGQRAGKKVVLRAGRRGHGESNRAAVKHVCLETVHRPGSRMKIAWSAQQPSAACAPNTARCATRVPAEGRWIIASDEVERRRVCFLGGRMKEQLFSGRPAVGETVLIVGAALHRDRSDGSARCR